jgi:hypothetical protein
MIKNIVLMVGFVVRFLLPAALCAGAVMGVLYLLPEPPPAAPQPSYLVRRGTFTIIDKRQNPDKSINPSYMEPNMRFTCVEEKP